MPCKEPSKVDVYLGLGANLGRRRRCIERALAAIEELPKTEVAATSDLYETKARFVEDQPDFLNACALVHTALEPQALLDALLAIEHAMGRVRTVDKGPRVIDLDILLYGDRVIDDEGLSIPHPGLDKRRFVLRPLVDIGADIVHPVSGQTIKQLLEQLSTCAEHH